MLARTVADQHATFLLCRKREIIADFRDHQFVAHVTGAVLKQDFTLAGEERLVEIRVDRQLA
ncbi:hypothetical protein THI4931_17400 [Pandoraea sputorum]|nr:hypothetical protein THI4931_17400 [Pandoraea sputorum]